MLTFQKYWATGTDRYSSDGSDSGSEATVSMRACVQFCIMCHFLVFSINFIPVIISLKTLLFGGMLHLDKYSITMTYLFPLFHMEIPTTHFPLCIFCQVSAIFSAGSLSMCSFGSRSLHPS